MKNPYFIHLRLQIGELVKRKQVLVFAETQEEAEKSALLNECHGEPTFEDGWVWDGGEYAYQVSRTARISDQQAHDFKALMAL